jgi:hypothetical protein
MGSLIRPWHLIVVVFILIAIVVVLVRRSRQSVSTVEPGVASWPPLTATILVTILFGVFGVIPAILHTDSVRKSGAATSRYWKAFGITMLASIVAYVLLVAGLFAIAASAA